MILFNVAGWAACSLHSHFPISISVRSVAHNTFSHVLNDGVAIDKFHLGKMSAHRRVHCPINRSASLFLIYTTYVSPELFSCQTKHDPCCQMQLILKVNKELFSSSAKSFLLNNSKTKKVSTQQSIQWRKTKARKKKICVFLTSAIEVKIGIVMLVLSVMFTMLMHDDDVTFINCNTWTC